MAQNSIKEQQFFLLTSGSYGEEIMKFLDNSKQILFVFVYCGVAKLHKTWAKQYPQIKLVTSQFTKIVESMKQYHQGLGLINIEYKSAYHFSDRDAMLEHLFIASIIKVLQRKSKNIKTKSLLEELFQFSENYIRENRNPKKIDKDLRDLNELINIFESETLEKNLMIYSYTKESFLYGMINNTIRKGNLLEIFHIRLPIYRLYQEISLLQSFEIQENTLYRGLCIDSKELNMWRQNLRLPLLLEGFTSTTSSKELAQRFMNLTYDQIRCKDRIQRVLIQIDISSQSLNQPVSISHLSAFKDEYEYLMQLNTFIEIKSIKEIQNYVEVICGLAVPLEVDKQFDEILKILKKQINELADFHYPTEYHNIAEIFSSLNMDQYAIDILEEQKTDADALDIIGRAYQGLGKYQLALDHINKSLELKKQQLGDKHISIVKELNNLGRIYQELGEYEKAIPYHQKELEIQKQMYREKHFSQSQTLDDLGRAYENLGKYSEALTRHMASLDIKKATMGAKHSSIASSLENIAINLQKLNRNEESLSYWLASLELKIASHGEKSMFLITNYDNIGQVYQILGQFERALHYQQKELEINQLFFKDEQKEIHEKLIYNYTKLGKYDKALQHKIKTLEITRYTVGVSNSQLANSYNSIAITYQSLGKFEEAVYNFKKALQITEKCQDESTSIYLDHIGSNYYMLGKYKEALQYQLQSLNIKEECFGLQNQSTALTYNNIGNTLQKLKKYEDALNYYISSLDIKRSKLGEIHASTGLTYYNIGNVYYELESYQEALQYLLIALHIQKKTIGEMHLDTAKTYNNLGLIYETINQPQQALKHYQFSQSIKSRLLGSAHNSAKVTQKNIDSIITQIQEVK